VLYDPPVAGHTLVDQKVKVGSTLLYCTPAKNTQRQNDAIVQSPGLVYFGSTTGNTFKFEPPFTEKPGKHQIYVDYYVDDNIVTDYYWLTVINLPPYLIE
jgi:sugar lactone lactonase YvrE